MMVCFLVGCLALWHLQRGLHPGPRVWVGFWASSPVIAVVRPFLVFSHLMIVKATVTLCLGVLCFSQGRSMCPRVPLTLTIALSVHEVHLEVCAHTWRPALGHKTPFLSLIPAPNAQYFRLWVQFFVPLWTLLILLSWALHYNRKVYFASWIVEGGKGFPCQFSLSSYINACVHTFICIWLYS